MNDAQVYEMQCNYGSQTPEVLHGQHRVRKREGNAVLDPAVSLSVRGRGGRPPSWAGLIGLRRLQSWAGPAEREREWAKGGGKEERGEWAGVKELGFSFF
jgi:hypothetical protein